MGEKKAACGLRFPSIVNNSNLGAETTEELIRSSYDKAEELCSRAGIPLFAVTAEKSVAGEGMFPMKLQKRPYEI